MKDRLVTLSKGVGVALMVSVPVLLLVSLWAWEWRWAASAGVTALTGLFFLGAAPREHGRVEPWPAREDL